MLADEVDTDEVEGEESAARRHQLVETDLVNEVSSQKLGHGVDHSTARCDTLDIYHRQLLLSPDAPRHRDHLVVAALCEGECLPVAQHPAHHRHVEEPGQYTHDYR